MPLVAVVVPPVAVLPRVVVRPPVVLSPVVQCHRAAHRHPILCVEDKVRNVFSPLVNIDSGGGFGWSRIPPKMIRWPLFFHLCSSLHSMEEAGDSAES